MATTHGLELLRSLQLFEPHDGMWANLGMRVTQADEAAVVIEGDFSLEAHGRAGQIHRGAVAALGEIATTVELLLDFFRPARAGRALARGTVLHRAGHLVYCAATVEQRGAVVAEAHATIALVRPA